VRQVAKYRQKLMLVDAVQWLGFDEGPQIVGMVPRAPGSPQAWIPTRPNGPMQSLDPGDMIVTGPDGVRTAYKPHIFVEMFEPAK
jgi:hypothetical protein